MLDGAVEAAVGLMPVEVTVAGPGVTMSVDRSMVAGPVIDWAEIEERGISGGIIP